MDIIKEIQIVRVYFVLGIWKKYERKYPASAYFAGIKDKYVLRVPGI